MSLKVELNIYRSNCMSGSIVSGYQIYTSLVSSYLNYVWWWSCDGLQLRPQRTTSDRGWKLRKQVDLCDKNVVDVFEKYWEKKERIPPPPLQRPYHTDVDGIVSTELLIFEPCCVLIFAVGFPSSPSTIEAFIWLMLILIHTWGRTSTTRDWGIPPPHQTHRRLQVVFIVFGLWSGWIRMLQRLAELHAVNRIIEPLDSLQMLLLCFSPHTSPPLWRSFVSKGREGHKRITVQCWCAMCPSAFTISVFSLFTSSEGIFINVHTVGLCSLLCL